MPKITYESDSGRVIVDVDEIRTRENGSFIELPEKYSNLEGVRYLPISRIYHIDFE